MFCKRQAQNTAEDVPVSRSNLQADSLTAAIPTISKNGGSWLPKP